MNTCYITKTKSKLYLPLFRDIISLWFPIKTKTLMVLKSCEFKLAVKPCVGMLLIALLMSILMISIVKI